MTNRTKKTLETIATELEQLAREAQEKASEARRVANEAGRMVATLADKTFEHENCGLLHRRSGFKFKHPATTWKEINRWRQKAKKNSVEGKKARLEKLLAQAEAVLSRLENEE